MSKLEQLEKNVADAYDAAYAAYAAAYAADVAAYVSWDAADDAFDVAYAADAAWKQAKLELAEYLKEQD